MIGPGARIDGRYTVLEPLGRGGTAHVWKVRHQGLGTLHALKVLSVASADLRERLLREGRLQAALKHPNVVAVTDVVDVEGAPGLLLEYVGGPSLKVLLAHRRLSPAQADLLFRGIARGLACAHRAGLVHRDLKPANVLLQPVDGGLVPKVTDFGLAKALAGSGDSLETRTGAVLGTPAYMAPEQVRDSSAVDARADVFALGVVAYELLTGVRAFEGEDAAETLGRVKAARFRPVRELCPEAPASMVEAIERALVADPAGRIGGVVDLLALWSRDAHEVRAGDSLVLDVERLAGLEGVEAVPIEVDPTWIDTKSRPSESTWDEAPGEPALPVVRPRSAPVRPALFAAGGLATFAAGVLVARLAAPPAPPPPSAPVATPSVQEIAAAIQADPKNQAVTDLGMSLGELSMAAAQHRTDLEWLRTGFEQEVRAIEAKAADAERKWPGTEAARAGRYYAALARFQAYSQWNSTTAPWDAPDEEKARWNEVIANELKPAARRSLEQSRARAEALAGESAPDSLYPRMAKQLLATMSLVQP